MWEVYLTLKLKVLNELHAASVIVNSALVTLSKRFTRQIFYKTKTLTFRLQNVFKIVHLASIRTFRNTSLKRLQYVLHNCVPEKRLPTLTNTFSVSIVNVS